MTELHDLPAGAQPGDTTPVIDARNLRIWYGSEGGPVKAVEQLRYEWVNDAETGMKRARIVEGKEQASDIQIEEQNQFALEMDHFAQCIQQNKDVHTPGEEGLQDVRIIELPYPGRIWWTPKSAEAWLIEAGPDGKPTDQAHSFYGGFGYGGFAQFNSFNNVVWRNDPDHIELSQPEGQGQAAGGGRGGGAPALSGGLKVVTTRMRPGYMRRNGIPYSVQPEHTVTPKRSSYPDNFRADRKTPWTH